MFFRLNKIFTKTFIITKKNSHTQSRNVLERSGPLPEKHCFGYHHDSSHPSKEVFFISNPVDIITQTIFSHGRGELRASATFTLII